MECINGSSPQTQCRQCREVLFGDLGKQTFHQKCPEFDSSNGVLYALKHKRHYRRDKMIGRVESRYIKDICEYQMQLSGEKTKYACFIYIERTIYNHDNPPDETPVKSAVGNAVILLAKGCDI